MLKKKHRLNLSQSENVTLFQRGQSRRLYSDFFIAYFRKSPSSQRANIVVPQACLKSAAKRNKLRRKLFVFFENSTLREKQMNLDLIVVLKRSFPTNTESLKVDLLSLLGGISKEFEK